jgi:hypothetical protein
MESLQELQTPASTPTKNPYLFRLEEAMSHLVEPLQEQLAEVNGAIEEKEQERAAALTRFLEELDELRRARRMITHALRGINPDLAPPLQKKKAKAKKSSGSVSQTGVGEEKLEIFTTWLQDHRDEINANGGHSARTLVNAYPELTQHIGHRSSVAKAMSALHERGLLHLDRWVQGRASADGSHRPGKYYKVA